MAGLYGVARTAEVALAATAKTVLQLIAPANQRLVLLGWGVSFDGTSGTAEPVIVELLRQTTAGTMTALTPVKTSGLSSVGETLQATAAHTATAEPTAGEVLDDMEVHPQGSYEKQLPAIPKMFDVPGGGRVGIRCTAPAGINVKCKIFYEE